MRAPDQNPVYLCGFRVADRCGLRPERSGDARQEKSSRQGDSQRNRTADRLPVRIQQRTGRFQRLGNRARRTRADGAPTYLRGHADPFHARRKTYRAAQAASNGRERRRGFARETDRHGYGDRYGRQTRRRRHGARQGRHRRYDDRCRRTLLAHDPRRQSARSVVPGLCPAGDRHGRPHVARHPSGRGRRDARRSGGRGLRYDEAAQFGRSRGSGRQPGDRRPLERQSGALASRRAAGPEHLLLRQQAVAFGVVQRPRRDFDRSGRQCAGAHRRRGGQHGCDQPAGRGVGLGAQRCLVDGRIRCARRLRRGAGHDQEPQAGCPRDQLQRFGHLQPPHGDSRRHHRRPDVGQLVEGFVQRLLQRLEIPAQPYRQYGALFGGDLSGVDPAAG